MRTKLPQRINLSFWIFTKLAAVGSSLQCTTTIDHPKNFSIKTLSEPLKRHKLLG